jgi:hypothetical protein
VGTIQREFTRTTDYAKSIEDVHQILVTSEFTVAQQQVAPFTSDFPHEEGYLSTMGHRVFRPVVRPEAKAKCWTLRSFTGSEACPGNTTRTHK